MFAHSGYQPTAHNPDRNSTIHDEPAHMTRLPRSYAPRSNFDNNPFFYPVEPEEKHNAGLSVTSMYPESYHRTEFIGTDYEPNSPLLPTLPPALEATTSYGAYSMYTPEPQSATTAASSSAHSSPQSAEFWGPSPRPSELPIPKTRKTRRSKPRIELAPDQPPTTQGKPRARVYVACVQCRTRKIRCDGGKPVCHNCGRRQAGDRDICNYDPAPKRRGPDKIAGARQRMVRDEASSPETGPVRRRRRKTERDCTPLPFSPPAPIAIAPSVVVKIRDDCQKTISPEVFDGRANYDQQRFESSSLQISSSYRPYASSPTQPFVRLSRAQITEVDEENNERPSQTSRELESDFFPLPSLPSLDFNRRAWWDTLLSMYTSHGSSQALTLTSGQRDSATQGIVKDIQWLLRASNYWFAFFHIPTFWSFMSVSQRERVQPSLILAALCLSTFFQSSELGHGKTGREVALRYADAAHTSLQASFDADWIDEQLAQAAWMMALFEVSAHPQHSTHRSTSSMVMLDAIIRKLALVTVDADNPAATTFDPRSVAVVFDDPNSPIDSDINQEPCSCVSLTLAHNWSQVSDHAPMWANTPAWKVNWTDAEIRRESCRRLCWSSMTLAAGHITYTTLSNQKQIRTLDLFISDPSNYAILFSGESISPNLHRKDTVWALSDRSFLLWHSCQRMRSDPLATDEEIGRFGIQAWLEAAKIERGLDRHTCDIEKSFIFHSRDYLFNTRMCVYYEFRQYMPDNAIRQHRIYVDGKVDAWLAHSNAVANRFMHLHTITGNKNNLLAQRPFFVFWFMGQVSRALLLWSYDGSLILALNVAKALCGPIEYLTSLWPCEEQRRRYYDLKRRLVKACERAGLPPP